MTLDAFLARFAEALRQHRPRWAPGRDVHPTGPYLRWVLPPLEALHRFEPMTLTYYAATGHALAPAWAYRAGLALGLQPDVIGLLNVASDLPVHMLEPDERAAKEAMLTTYDEVLDALSGPLR